MTTPQIASFASDSLANLIGTFVGAVLAILSTWWYDRRSRRTGEIRSIQSVIDRIHRSRALRPGRERRPGPLSEAEYTDFERCCASVLATRDLAAQVKMDISVLVDTIPPLEAVYVDCLDFLDNTEIDPEDFIASLMQLRESLTLDIAELCKIEPRLEDKSPGTAQERVRAARAPVSAS